MKILEESGYIQSLKVEKSLESEGRLENLKELVNAMSAFDNMIGFLEHIALVNDSDAEHKDGQISLMTLHAAKGLEFSVVFIVGVEEDLFPSQMMISSREDLEEERRLFYVAITRAMKKLYLTYSSTRYRYGMLKDCEKSRFIKEISPAYLDFDNFNTNRSLVSNVLKEKKRNLSPIKKVSTNNSSSIKSSNIDDLIEGVNVKHEIFGIGTIKKVDNHSNQKKAIVNFKNVGEKTLLLNFAKLKVIK